MNTEEFDMLLFLKLRKKNSQNVKKEQRFWIRKFLRNVPFYARFLTFVKQARIFLTFSVSDSSWLNNSGDFLILFS